MLKLVKNIGEREGAGSMGGKERKGGGQAALQEEVAAMKAALRLAWQSLESEGDDIVKLGGLIARLSDSIGRALTAQQRLAAGNDNVAQARAELDRIFRALDVGEE